MTFWQWKRKQLLRQLNFKRWHGSYNDKDKYNGKYNGKYKDKYKDNDNDI